MRGDIMLGRDNKAKTEIALELIASLGNTKVLGAVSKLFPDQVALKKILMAAASSVDSSLAKVSNLFQKPEPAAVQEKAPASTRRMGS